MLRFSIYRASVTSLRGPDSTLDDISERTPPLTDMVGMVLAGGVAPARFRQAGAYAALQEEGGALLPNWLASFSIACERGDHRRESRAGGWKMLRQFWEVNATDLMPLHARSGLATAKIRRSAEPVQPKSERGAHSAIWAARYLPTETCHRAHAGADDTSALDRPRSAARSAWTHSVDFAS